MAGIHNNACCRNKVRCYSLQWQETSISSDKILSLQDLLEAIKPILDEDLQEAVESLLMETAFHDAKSLYIAMKVR